MPESWFELSSADQSEALEVAAGQEKKITSAVRSRLPQWIEETVQPFIEQALVACGLQAELRLGGKDSDKLIIIYPATKKGTGYATATIQLEFGARATFCPRLCLSIL